MALFTVIEARLTGSPQLRPFKPIESEQRSLDPPELDTRKNPSL
jgi:hypothetical protein